MIEWVDKIVFQIKKGLTGKLKFIITQNKIGSRFFFF